MKIFLKYVLKSMVEKKGRFLLLIIAISLSTGLFLASLGTVDIALDALIKPSLESLENKDIYISATEDGYFTDLENMNDKGIKNILKEVTLNCTYLYSEDEVINITLHGREEKYINKDYLIEGELSDLTGEKCFISKRVSEDRNLQVGDKIEIILGGKNTVLEIAGIHLNEGVLYSDNSSSFGVIVAYNYLSSNLGYEGKYNFITANSSEDTVQKGIDLFNDNNKDYEATMLFNEDAIKEQTASFSQILYFMLAIVVFMSAIIIYSSFKLIITERMNVIGTFLSQGATKKTIQSILYLESLLYGIVGAIVGIILGYEGLNLINKIISPLAEYKIYETIDVDFNYFIFAGIFAILLSVISAILPIKKIKKLEVKDVILNNTNVSMNVGYIKFIFGIVLFVINTVIAYIKGEWTNNVSIIFIFLTFISVILIYPKLVDLLSSLVYKVLKGRSKSIVLAINNIRTSKVLLGNTTLIIIAIMCIFMITSIGTSVKNSVGDAYKKLDYDISISGISTVRQEGITSAEEVVEKLETFSGYETDSCNLMYSTNGVIHNSDEGFYVLAVDEVKFLNYNKYVFDNEKSINEFKKIEDGIIISTTIAKNLDLKLGDTINLSINDLYKDIEVKGIIDGKMFYNGYVAYITFDTLRDKYNLKGATEMSIKTNKDPDEFKDDIKTLTKEFGVSILTRQEQNDMNDESNEMIITVLSIFSFMSIIIAALGILNNITISFLQRKREISVLASIGMSKGKRNKMLITESIITVIWAVIVSIPGTFIVLKLITKLLSTMDMQLSVTFDYSQIPSYFFAALLIVIIATLPVIFKSKKLSIIDELKYE